VGDDVFQLDELVNPYRVALSNYLEENSKFCIAENTFINVDIEELKDVLRTTNIPKLMKKMIEMKSMCKIAMKMTMMQLKKKKKKTILINLHNTYM